MHCKYVNTVKSGIKETGFHVKIGGLLGCSFMQRQPNQVLYRLVSADSILSYCTTFYIFVQLWHVVGHFFMWVLFAGACLPRPLPGEGYES